MKIEYTPESLRDLQKIREIIIDRFMDILTENGIEKVVIVTG